MGLFAKFGNSLSRDTVDRNAYDELTWHLEQRTQEYINSGMPAAEARASAQKRLGNLTLLKEHTAESDLLVWFELAKRDIALAFRMLRRAPTVTAIAVLSLALGIGANTVVFTLMKQVVLDYLPVPRARTAGHPAQPGTRRRSYLQQRYEKQLLLSALQGLEPGYVEHLRWGAGAQVYRCKS